MREAVISIFYNLSIGANQINFLKESFLENEDLNLYSKCANFGIEYQIFHQEITAQLLNIVSPNENYAGVPINERAEEIIENFRSLSEQYDEQIYELFHQSLRSTANIFSNISAKSHELSETDLSDIRNQIVNLDLEQMI